MLWGVLRQPDHPCLPAHPALSHSLLPLQCLWLRCRAPAPAAASPWVCNPHQLARCPPSRHPWRRRQRRSSPPAAAAAGLAAGSAAARRRRRLPSRQHPPTSPTTPLRRRPCRTLAVLRSRSSAEALRPLLERSCTPAAGCSMLGVCLQVLGHQPRCQLQLRGSMRA